MPSGSYRQVDVKCPFYKYDDGKRHIVCEGAFDCEDSLTSAFRHKDKYDMQMDKHCCYDYEQCGIYQMLAKKYDDE